MRKNKTICVLGLGYIGLPTALFLAKAGYKVIGVDSNKNKIDDLIKRKFPFQEAGFPKLFKEAIKNLSFSLVPEKADVFIISVPTPITKNRKPDLRFVKQAAEDINKILNDKNLIIIESTIPPGTAKEIVLPIFKKRHKNYRIYLSHAPERAIPGKTLKEMVEDDRVIGGIDKKSSNLTKEIYSSFVKGKIYLTDTTTAEFVKIIENTYRDVNIAFANELAKLCDKIKINVWEAIKLANLHPRVNINLPGPGVGGHCLAIDPWFLVRKDDNGTQAIKLARTINDSMPDYVINLISKTVKNIKKPTITILGAAYKANIDDWRETPALKIIKLAKKKGWQVKIHDPYIKNFPYKLLNIKEALKNSDCAVLVTNHDFYKEVDFKKYAVKNIVDTRNFLDKNKLEDINLIVLGGKNNI
ncbi:nucleotide sugar dehydrogenase [Candidatus Parcubacteria bacterium]|nr:nucleotide sugar dehydrogenase [Candidatus Parcubacteria bacterium]